MTSQIKGIPQALGLLKHNVHLQSVKLGQRINEANDRLTKAFAGAHTFVDGVHSDVAEVESFTSEIEAATNGGPPLNDTHPAMTDQDHTTRDSNGSLVHKPG